jgi:excisionase family DNA binding protein
VSGQLRSELEPLLERLAGRIAERVWERLVEHQAVAASAHSPWMGIDKAAAYLDWPNQRLYKLTASGEIPHYKHEGRLLFHRAELNCWLSTFAEGPTFAQTGRQDTDDMANQQEMGQRRCGTHWPAASETPDAGRE